MNSSNGGFNAQAAVGYLIAHATPNYDEKLNGHCAKAVRLALQQGGINTAAHPVDAKDYGRYLKQWGFSAINKSGYNALLGDIRVFQPYPGGSAAGHIDMYSGSKWVSDFMEHNLWPGAGYGKYQNFEVYRWAGNA